MNLRDKVGNGSIYVLKLSHLWLAMVMLRY